VYANFNKTIYNILFLVLNSKINNYAILTFIEYVFIFVFIARKI